MDQINELKGRITCFTEIKASYEREQNMKENAQKKSNENIDNHNSIYSDNNNNNLVKEIEEVKIIF
jgi:hypothetical protein